MKKEWGIPPEQSGAFVAAMENVFDLYCKPYDECHPLVCLDEMPKQLIGETRKSYTAPDGVVRYDTEYTRNGTANVFLAVEPLAGRRFGQVMESKTKNDFAVFVEEIARQYPEAEDITLVCDNLNTHEPGSFYEAFDAETARRLARKIRIVHTPKHGSWLDIAKIELSVLSRQNFNRRIATVDEMSKELDAWLAERNANKTKVSWQFTTADARIKLKSLYPRFS